MKNAVAAGAVIRFRGIVQGVGFRPLLYRRARQCALKGVIRNTGQGVCLKVDGERDDIERFYCGILRKPPVMAEIHDSSIEFTAPEGFEDLTIAASSRGGAVFTPVSPDIATCGSCLRELEDPADRRFGYAFTNCTDCGPRFTIVRGIPYDRSNTTMDIFPMCPACSAEYGDIENRRYHAQPNACPVCGPALRFVDMREGDSARDEPAAVAGEGGAFAAGSGGQDTYAADAAGSSGDRKIGPGGGPEIGPGSGPIEKTLEYLRRGLIVAVRGLGGYHLAVCPRRAGWVARLRDRKNRPGKPFALMARDLDTVRMICLVDEEEERLLLSPARPIVLLKRRGAAGAGDFAATVDRSALDEVAPDTDRLGVMLPYTPLHHLLMRGEELLIMTSANLSEEPLAFSEGDALYRLRGIADGMLTHNREIARPCDDSVAAVVRGRPVIVRRSRGYVPRAVLAGAEPAAGGPERNPAELSCHVDGEDMRSARHAPAGTNAAPNRQVFAAGAHEKNVFCVYKDGKAFLSHHIGDLQNARSIDAYERGVADFLDMFQVSPGLVACDLHPDYFSTRFAESMARRLDVPLVRVQHHCAHIAAVLAEHMPGDGHAPGVDRPDSGGFSPEDGVIGVAFDGTGFGTDGTMWGGEFLVLDHAGFRRAAHYEAVPMPGGEACVTHTDRMAAAYLFHAFGRDLPGMQVLDGMDAGVLESLLLMIRGGVNTPLTSSCGRLFDAVSALLGVCTRPSYDAQGAILLERLAGDGPLPEPYPYALDAGGVLSFKPMLEAVVRDVRGGAPAAETAARFHSTIVESAVEACRMISGRTGIRTAALSGGVFQNRVVLTGMWERLEREGFRVLFHRQAPPNDGGIALGQVAAALRGWAA